MADGKPFDLKRHLPSTAFVVIFLMVLAAIAGVYIYIGAYNIGADAAFSKAVPGKVTRRAGEAAGNIAWIATEGRTTGTWKAKAIDRVTTETMVLRRSGGGWKIVHVHWSSAQAH